MIMKRRDVYSSMNYYLLYSIHMPDGGINQYKIFQVLGIYNFHYFGL